MNRIKSLIVALLFTANAFAQSPQKMSYQAVVRDANDVLVSNSTIGMQVSVLKGSASGSSVYVETQSPSSNANGLVSIEIGNGTVVSGSFSTIDWSDGPYFLKTETDPSGGTGYTITGTSQLLSVPYALHASTAGKVVSGEKSAASVYLSANVTIPNAWPPTTVAFDSEQFDLLNEFNTTTHKFTATNAGLYQINVSIAFDPNVSGINHLYIIHVYVNGVDKLQKSKVYDGNATPVVVSTSRVLQLAANDVVEVLAYQDTGIPRLLIGNLINSGRTFFDIVKLD